MYSERHFRIRSLEEIMKDLEIGKCQSGKDIESIFFGDGNTILMKTKDLLKLLDYCKELLRE